VHQYSLTSALNLASGKQIYLHSTLSINTRLTHAICPFPFQSPSWIPGNKQKIANTYISHVIFSKIHITFPQSNHVDAQWPELRIPLET
jgi:hypothetical protein